MSQPILEIQGLQVALPTGADRAHAVDGVSLSIAPGRTLCVVGESGSGKSVMSTTVMGLLPRELRVVDALPRNPTGKVLKGRLREQNTRH